jgi:hypothetical protein
MCLHFYQSSEFLRIIKSHKNYFNTKIGGFTLTNLSYWHQAPRLALASGIPAYPSKKKWDLVLHGICKFWLADQGAAYPMKNFDFGPSWDTVAQNPPLVCYLTFWSQHFRLIYYYTSVHQLIWSLRGFHANQGVQPPFCIPKYVLCKRLRHRSVSRRRKAHIIWQTVGSGATKYDDWSHMEQKTLFPLKII